MAELGEVISRLRALNEPVPKPMRLPSVEEVGAVETMTGVSFPPDFKRYLLQGSDVAFGALEPVTVTVPHAHTHFPKVLAHARKFGMPLDLIPICEDNADFYCVAPTGEVVFWSHNGPTDERWPSIASWIEDVWIGENSD